MKTTCLEIGHDFKPIDNESRPTGDRCFFKRCCGQRMAKVCSLVVNKCERCGEERRHTWGVDAVCNICGDKTCIGTPYG